MGNFHGRYRRDPLAAKLARLGRSPARQPRGTQKTQKEAKANSKKDSAQQQQNTINNESTKEGRKKKAKSTSDHPRKESEESYTCSRYIPPTYIPSVPREDDLGGLYDAVMYNDPYTIAREKLQNPPKPATIPTTQHDQSQLYQARYTPPRYQPRATYTPPQYQPRVGPSSYQPAHGKTVDQNTKKNYGASANDCLYLDSMYNDNHESVEPPYWHNAEDNTEGRSPNDFSCDGSSVHGHDSDTGYEVSPGQIEHHAGESGDGYDFTYDGDAGGDQDRGAHDVGESYDIGVDTGASYDVGVDSGGVYDCGGSRDAGGI